MKLFTLAVSSICICLLSCSSNAVKHSFQDSIGGSANHSAKIDPALSKEDLTKSKTNQISGSNSGSTSGSTSGLKIADVQTILTRKQVPILCYHHIRPLKPGKTSRDYEVTPEEFADQMKALVAAGYKTILPDQLYAYLASGVSIPEKSVMLTFDDTDAEQFTIGKTEMEKYGFKGVFFIMTISINRPHYLTKDQIKQLSDAGNSICCHTWDHHMVTKYSDDDWKAQLIKPRKKLEDIIGRKIDYFAYPFGLWNENAVKHLKDNNIKMAFQLASKRSPSEPLYTVRRILVPGSWSVQRLMKSMESDFKGITKP